MNQQEKVDFKELTDLMQDFLKDKRDPGNGWKTDRRVFEQKTVDTLKVVSDTLKKIETDVSVIPSLCNEVAGIQKWRKAFNKVMLFLGVSVFGLIVKLDFEHLK